MVYLKACRRCNGDMYLDRDANGSYRQCLQCGCVVDLPEADRPVYAALAQRRAS